MGLFEKSMMMILAQDTGQFLNLNHVILMYINSLLWGHYGIFSSTPGIYLWMPMYHLPFLLISNSDDNVPGHYS